MRDRGAGEVEENPRVKRQKLQVSSADDKTSVSSKGRLDPATNPYLAHMFNDEESNDTSEGYEYSNGYGGVSTGLRQTDSRGAGGLDSFARHQTTAAMAKKAEDGPNNPFNGRPFSQQYMSILKKRRDLPVHYQR